jgi:rod shape-determining protein MreD
VKDGFPFWLFLTGLVVLHFFLHLTLGLDTRAPDLLVVAMLLGARALPGGGAAAFGFALGLLEDAVSLAAFGAAAATFAAVGYLGSRSRDLLEGDSAFFLALYLFLGAWIQKALYYAVAGAVRRGEPVEALLIQAPLHSLYAAVVGAILVAGYRMIRR